MKPIQNGVTWTDLEVHPGGPDGGQFPRESSLEIFQVLLPTGIAQKIEYTYSSPRSSCDTFCDHPKEDWNDLPTRESALLKVQSELEAARQVVENLSRLQRLLLGGVQYSTECEDDPVED